MRDILHYSAEPSHLIIGSVSLYYILQGMSPWLPTPSCVDCARTNKMVSVTVRQTDNKFPLISFRMSVLESPHFTDRLSRVQDSGFGIYFIRDVIVRIVDKPLWPSFCSSLRIYNLLLDTFASV